MKQSKCCSKIDVDHLDYIVIDQFAKREVYQHYALSELPFPKTQFETKGESKSLAIAAASIISRYAFVKHMNQITQQIKMEVPKVQVIKLTYSRLKSFKNLA